MSIYQHTQRGTLIRWALGGSLAFFVILRLAMGTPLSAADTIIGLVSLVILASLVLMHSMTVTVEARDLMVSLGPGLIRRSVPLAEISSARATRNPWYYGWGLRITNRGPLWRVSGFDAVELELPKGRFLVGTDDPEGLMAALARAGVHALKTL